MKRTLPLVLVTLSAGATFAAPPRPSAKPPVKKPGAKPGAKPPLIRRPPHRNLPSRGGYRPLGPPTLRSILPAPPVAPAVRAAVSALPTPGVLAFRTAAEYDSRLDLRGDFVVVSRFGEAPEGAERALQSWRSAGYPVHRALLLNQDPASHFLSGKADGMAHPDDQEVEASGVAITAGNRPYVVPGTAWMGYLREQVRRSLDAGAGGVWATDPALPAAGGYSPAFQAAWQQAYQTPWEAPHSSPTAFFRASRLKADLQQRALDDLLRHTREQPRGNGRAASFMVALDSPLSYGQRSLLFPHAAMSRLPVQGVVGQVSADPAQSLIPYEGKTEAQVFENSWLQYSYFANLLDGVPDKMLYFRTAPAAADAPLTAEQRERAWKATVASSLLFPQPRGYEIGASAEQDPADGGATVAPGASTLAGNVAAALREIPAQPTFELTGGTRGIGILTLDTALWQRGGPRGSSMRSVYGLALPLLKRGIPVEMVPAERAADPQLLSKFKVLLLSYDMQKPLGPEVNQRLGEWVRGGGALVLFGGEDAYNDIGEWWTRSGFPGPTDHLLRECGARVEVALRSVTNGAERYTEALKAEGPFAEPAEGAAAPTAPPADRKVYTLPLARFQMEGKPLYLRLTDLYPEVGPSAWLGRVRVLQGGRVRADFVAGSVAERAFLVDDVGSHPGAGGRRADGEGAFSYRFNGLGADATVELELAGHFRVGVATGTDPSARLQPERADLPALRVGSSYPVVGYPLAGAEPLYRIPGQEAVPVWASAAGAGQVVYCGLPAAFGLDSSPGAGSAGDLIRGLVRYACQRRGVSYQEAPLVAKRGAYVIAHALGRTAELKGHYLNLFHPDMPLVENPSLPYREPVLYKSVQMTSRVPTLLHGTHRVRVNEANVARMRLAIEGPQGSQGTLRIFSAGMSLGGVEATDATGRKVDVEARVEGRTLRVRYAQPSGGLSLAVRWIRPEERLTK